MAADSAEAHHQTERANRTLEKLGRERTALMQAHDAGAVPVDLLKSEMDRLTRSMAAAERQVEVTTKQLREVEGVIEQALAVAANCHVQYQVAPDFVRRQINQGFFEKLWISQDGHVERYQLTEPFAVLLERGGTGGLTAARVGQRESGDEGAGEADLGGDENTPTSGEGRGVKVGGLVDLFGALSHPCFEVLRLLAMADEWAAAADCGSQTQPTPAYVSRQQPSLVERLGEAGVHHLISHCRAGLTQQELAERYGTSLSSIKRLLRAQGVSCRTHNGSSTCHCKAKDLQ